MATTDVPAVVALSGEAGAGRKGLKSGAIGLLSNTVIGISSVAPAYSLASALGFVIVYVGIRAPAVMILAFLPMLLVAFAYQQLNKAMPDCGTTFTWATKAFGPRTGWMGGWAIVAADVIVMANLGQIAGQYMFHLFDANGLAASTAWTTVAGIGWIVAMTFICFLGIEISARIQYALLAIEVIMLLVFSVVALTKVGAGSAPAGAIHPALAWFNPFAGSSFSDLTSGLLIAVFIYWGWDTAVSINEETRDGTRAPGQAALISTLVLLVTYVLVATAAESFAGVGTKGIGLANPNNSGDVLSVLGKAVFGSHGFGSILARLLVLMVLSSAAASTLTTILPTARTTLSMAAYRAIPAKFARIHRRFRTPSWSTIGMGVLSVGFYLVMVLVSKHVLADTISAIGLLIAFYYGMTGFACVWWFRHDLHRPKDILLKGVAPLLGGLMLLGMFVIACINFWKADYGSTSWTLPFSPHWRIGGVFLTGVGSLVIGLVLMVIYRFVNPPFFRGRTLTKDTPVLIPEDATLAEIEKITDSTLAPGRADA